MSSYASTSGPAPSKPNPKPPPPPPRPKPMAAPSPPPKRHCPDKPLPTHARSSPEDEEEGEGTYRRCEYCSEKFGNGSHIQHQMYCKFVPRECGDCAFSGPFDAIEKHLVDGNCPGCKNFTCDPKKFASVVRKTLIMRSDKTRSASLIVPRTGDHPTFVYRVYFKDHMVYFYAKAMCATGSGNRVHSSTVEINGMQANAPSYRCKMWLAAWDSSWELMVKDLEACQFQIPDHVLICMSQIDVTFAMADSFYQVY